MSSDLTPCDEKKECDGAMDSNPSYSSTFLSLGTSLPPHLPSLLLLLFLYKSLSLCIWKSLDSYGTASWAVVKREETGKGRSQP